MGGMEGVGLRAPGAVAPLRPRRLLRRAQRDAHGAAPLVLGHRVRGLAGAPGGRLSPVAAPAPSCT